MMGLKIAGSVFLLLAICAVRVHSLDDELLKRLNLKGTIKSTSCADCRKQDASCCPGSDPAHYLDENSEIFYIKVPHPDKKIVLTFRDGFDVEGGNKFGCIHDAVFIFDSDGTETADARGGLCNTNRPMGSYNSSGNKMIVMLKTDILNAKNQETGFIADWTVDTINPIEKCKTIKSMTCTECRKQNLGCCTADSENFPNDYSQEFLLSASVESNIKLEFSAFNVEGKDWDGTGCTHDFVRVFDDKGLPLTAPLCGTTIPEPVEYIGRMMTVFFKTDSSGSSKGFTASWGANVVDAQSKSATTVTTAATTTATTATTSGTAATTTGTAATTTGTAATTTGTAATTNATTATTTGVAATTTGTATTTTRTAATTTGTAATTTGTAATTTATVATTAGTAAASTPATTTASTIAAAAAVSTKAKAK